MAIKLWEFVWKTFENVLRGPSIHSLLSPRLTFEELELRIYTWKLGVRKRNHWPKPSWTCATRSNDTFFFLITFPYFIELKINHLLISQNRKLWDTLKEKHVVPTLTKLTMFWGKKKRDSNTCISLQSVRDSPCWDSGMKCCESSGGKKSIFTWKCTHSVYIATRALCHLHRLQNPWLKLIAQSLQYAYDNHMSSLTKLHQAVEKDSKY